MNKETLEVLLSVLQRAPASQAEVIVVNGALAEIRGLVNESPSEGPESNLQQHHTADAGHDEQPVD